MSLSICLQKPPLKIPPRVVSTVRTYTEHVTPSADQRGSSQRSPPRLLPLRNDKTQEFIHLLASSSLRALSAPAAEIPSKGRAPASLLPHVLLFFRLMLVAPLQC